MFYINLKRNGKVTNHTPSPVANKLWKNQGQQSKLVVLNKKVPANSAFAFGSRLQSWVSITDILGWVRAHRWAQRHRCGTIRCWLAVHLIETKLRLHQSWGNPISLSIQGIHAANFGPTKLRHSCQDKVSEATSSKQWKPVLPDWRKEVTGDRGTTRFPPGIAVPQFKPKNHVST